MDLWLVANAQILLESFSLGLLAGLNGLVEGERLTRYADKLRRVEDRLGPTELLEHERHRHTLTKQEALELVQGEGAP